MADLHELLLKYLDMNKEKYEEVLNCINNKEGDDQQCVENFGDDALKIYYQSNKPSEDDKNLVAICAIDKKVSNPTNKERLDDTLNIIKEAAGSNSVEDFCNNHFDTFSPNKDALSKWMKSEFEDKDTERKKIVSMIYAIMKYYKKNGTTN